MPVAALSHSLGAAGAAVARSPGSRRAVVLSAARATVSGRTARATFNTAVPRRTAGRIGSACVPRCVSSASDGKDTRQSCCTGFLHEPTHAGGAVLAARSEVRRSAGIVKLCSGAPLSGSDIYSTRTCRTVFTARSGVALSAGVVGLCVRARLSASYDQTAHSRDNADASGSSVKCAVGTGTTWQAACSAVARSARPADTTMAAIRGRSVLAMAAATSTRREASQRHKRTQEQPLRCGPP
jgi:hypothetical protein